MITLKHVVYKDQILNVMVWDTNSLSDVCKGQVGMRWRDDHLIPTSPSGTQSIAVSQSNFATGQALNKPPSGLIRYEITDDLY